MSFSVTIGVPLFLSHPETCSLWCGRIVFVAHFVVQLDSVFPSSSESIWCSADDCKDAFKTLERIQHPRETTVRAPRRIIPRHRIMLLRQLYYEPNQLVLKWVQGCTWRGINLNFSQVVCLLISCICYKIRGVDPGTAGSICHGTDSSGSANKEIDPRSSPEKDMLVERLRVHKL